MMSLLRYVNSQPVCPVDSPQGQPLLLSIKQPRYHLANSISYRVPTKVQTQMDLNSLLTRSKPLGLMERILSLAWFCLDLRLLMKLRQWDQTRGFHIAM